MRKRSRGIISPCYATWLLRVPSSRQIILPGISAMQRCGQNKGILAPISVHNVGIIGTYIIEGFTCYCTLISRVAKFSGICIAAACYGFSAAFVNQVVAYYAASGSCYITFRIRIHLISCATISRRAIWSQRKRNIKVFCISNGAECTKNKYKSQNTGYNLSFQKTPFSDSNLAIKMPQFSCGTRPNIA